MVPQFGSVVVRLAGYQGGALVFPTLARVSAFLSSRLMVGEYNSSVIYVLFYIIICVWYCVGSSLMLSCFVTDSSGRVISSSQRPLPDNTQHSQEKTPMPPAGFEFATPSSERPQTNALDQCFSTAGPWHQLYRAARDSLGNDN